MKKQSTALLFIVLALTVMSCQNTPSSNTSISASSSLISSESVSSSSIVEAELYTVYSSDGVVKLQTENMWTAIIEAGKSSKSSDRYYVQDHDGTVIYKYSLVKYYQYLGTTYAGATEDLAAAKLWAKEHPDSYVIDGKAYEFVALGEEKISTTKNFTRGYELNAGSFLYLFSDKYTQNPEQLGYTYMSFTLRFSEAQIKYPSESTEQGWNAYVFVNIMLDSPFQNCDIGIINNWEGHKGEWKPVFNLNGVTYTPDTSAVITQMAYDPITDSYGDADDLLFEIYATEEEYVLNITNLTSSQEFSFTAKNSMLSGNVQKSYLLLASSFCPVQKNTEIWNPRSGASFTNVVFENVKIAQYQADDDYSDATMFDYGPGSDALDYGLVNGKNNAHYTSGVRETAGSYPSGAMYEVGDTYLISHIYYDDRERT